MFFANLKGLSHGLSNELDIERSRQAGLYGVQSVIFLPELQVITSLVLQLVLQISGNLVLYQVVRRSVLVWTSEVLRRSWFQVAASSSISLNESSVSLFLPFSISLYTLIEILSLLVPTNLLDLESRDSLAA